MTLPTWMVHLHLVDVLPIGIKTMRYISYTSLSTPIQQNIKDCRGKKGSFNKLISVLHHDSSLPTPGS